MQTLKATTGAQTAALTWRTNVMDFDVTVSYAGDKVMGVQVWICLLPDEWCELAASRAWQGLVAHLHNTLEQEEILKQHQQR